jgi:hypothetical protein
VILPEANNSLQPASRTKMAALTEVSDVKVFGGQVLTAAVSFLMPSPARVRSFAREFDDDDACVRACACACVAPVDSCNGAPLTTLPSTPSDDHSKRCLRTRVRHANVP